MVKDKILILTKAAKLPNGMEFPEATEFHIVMGVLYMKGFPVPQSVQQTMLTWIEDNPNLFREIFR